MMRARIRERSWLKVVIDLECDSGWFVIEYNGRGAGYESVYVNGRLVAQARDWLWFVPRFEFRLGALSAAIEVRVWPWLMLRSFRLIVDGTEVPLDGNAVQRSGSSREGSAAPQPHEPQVGIRVVGQVRADHADPRNSRPH